MLNRRIDRSLPRRFRLDLRLTPLLLLGALLVKAAPAAADDLSMVRDLAGRVGPIIGSALACPNLARSRSQLIIDKFQAAIREASSSDADRSDVARLFDRYVVDGRTLVSSGKIDCRLAERQISDLEQSLGIASPPSTLQQFAAPAPAAPPPAIAAAPAQTASTGSVHGVTDKEIRFGMSIPFSGSGKENAQSYKQGIEVAFNKVNDAGGVNGRMLKLIAGDDGFEPSRTLGVMKTLWDTDQVFGFFGNFGTATADVSIPFALEHRALFFAPYTGSNGARHDPPDRYVFNYRPSFGEEADTAVRYLLKVRKIRPNQIAFFGENDGFGDQGYAGVAKAFRAIGVSDTSILRTNYTRNTIDVDDAVNRLRASKIPIRAVVMTANTRPAAKFIEKTHDLFPGMVYTNMSFSGGTALADELKLLGPRFLENVIMTQVVPAVSGYSTEVLDFKTALAKFAPGTTPDYVALEGFIAANLLIDALKRCGPQVETERLVDVLESTKNLDLGLGVTINYSRGDHQALHKLWGTQLDENGKFQSIDLE